MRTVLIVAVTITMAALLPAQAKAPEGGADEPEPPICYNTVWPVCEPPMYGPEEAPGEPGTREAYQNMLYAISHAKGLPEGKIREIEVVIGGAVPKAPECPSGESNWQALAVGDHGTSFGLVQIHLPAHPHITQTQALNPEFALNFIVDEFIAGNEWKWTCWRAYFQ